MPQPRSAPLPVTCAARFISIDSNWKSSRSATQSKETDDSRLPYILTREDRTCQSLPTGRGKPVASNAVTAPATLPLRLSRCMPPQAPPILVETLTTAPRRVLAFLPARQSPRRSGALVAQAARAKPGVPFTTGARPPTPSLPPPSSQWAPSSSFVSSRAVATTARHQDGRRQRPAARWRTEDCCSWRATDGRGHTPARVRSEVIHPSSHGNSCGTSSTSTMRSTHRSRKGGVVCEIVYHADHLGVVAGGVASIHPSLHGTHSMRYSAPSREGRVGVASA